MKKSLIIPLIHIFFSIAALFYLSPNLSAQIFTDSGRESYNFNVEAGFQSSQFKAGFSESYLLKEATADGIFLIFRSNSTLLYGSFGKYQTGSISSDFFIAGLEAPLIPFIKSFGRNEAGILVSLLSDYVKWARVNDSSNSRLDISSFGLSVGGFYKLKFPIAELSGKLSVGYGYSFQYIGQETGNEWVARFSSQILFPNVTDYFGLSGSIFANYTNWDIKNDNLKTTILTMGITAGVAF